MTKPAPLKTCLIWLIQGYRHVISPLLPPTCRYTPTCSQYALEAIDRYGAGRGTWLATKRVLRCHPLRAGGYDPVPSDLWQVGNTSLEAVVRNQTSQSTAVDSETSSPES